MPNSQLKRRLLGLVDKLPKRVGQFFAFVLAAPRQFLTIDVVRYVICLARYFWFVMLVRRLRTVQPLPSGVSRNAITHNLRGVTDFAVDRSHHLIRPIVAIDKIRSTIASLRVLAIGSRAEGEIYNLIGYGFRSSNVRGLDLISYSPYIDLGDMHSMPYADSSHDVVILGWVLAYSDDRQAAVKEIIRVVKDGGVIAVSAAYTRKSNHTIVEEMGYLPGSEDRFESQAQLEQLFKGHIGYVYFSQGDEQDMSDKERSLTLVFSVRK